mmetsp:Transcript_4294/g.12175  ORF Transcript_4294/g.12175 Transcript_4294/m.12175 type:complete len:81 (+) Transcript_4294:1430-1672(+)
MHEAGRILFQFAAPLACERGVSGRSARSTPGLQKVFGRKRKRAWSADSEVDNALARKLSYFDNAVCLGVGARRLSAKTTS